MTDQDKIAAIIQAIQDDQNLLKVIRASATMNIPHVTSETLEMLMQLLNLPEN